MTPKLLRPLAWLAAVSALIAVAGAIQPIDAGGPAQTPKRLVAIGDLHADIAAARRAFRLAGATDERDVWIGGNLVVVQTGDVIGRGTDERAMLDFLFDLQAKAKAAGGTLHLLLGNHEVFAARPDHRWVDPGAFAAYRGIPGLNLRHPSIAELPDDERARAAAFMPGGVYARRLSAFPLVLRVGDTIFAHGGVLPMWAKYGIDRINADVREWLAGRSAEPAATLGLDDGSADDGVMWSRHFAAAPEEVACALAKESLTLLGAKRMVIAHTVQKAIMSRCDDQIWAIDVGISRYYGGQLQVLEIVEDRKIRVISVNVR